MALTGRLGTAASRPGDIVLGMGEALDIDEGSGASRTATDTTSVTDSLAHVLGHVRTAVDTVNTTDAIAVASVLVRELSDTTSTSEAVDHEVGTGEQNLTRTAVDTVATTESPDRLLGAVRTASDTVATTDSIGQSLGMPRTASDSVTSGDAVTHAKGIVRAISDYAFDGVFDGFDRPALGSNWSSDNSTAVVVNGELTVPAGDWDWLEWQPSLVGLPTIVKFDFYVPAESVDQDDTYYGFELDAAGRYTYIDNVPVGTFPGEWYISPGGGVSRHFVPSYGEWHTVRFYAEGLGAGDAWALKVWPRDDAEPAAWSFTGTYPSAGTPYTVHGLYIDSSGANNTESARMDNVSIAAESDEVLRALVLMRQPSEELETIEFPLPLLTPVAADEGDISTGYAPQLAAPIDDTQTTITVTEPLPGGMTTPFVVAIDGEQMLVTSVSGTTWTVVRNYNGSSASPHGSGAVARPALANLKVGGIDVTADVNYFRSRFTTASNGQAGTAEIWIRDLQQAWSFVTGAEVVLRFRGVRVWGGYLASVRREFVFNSGTGSDDEPRWLILDAVDYNVLFNRRVYFDPADPSDMYVRRWANGTHDSTVIGHLVSNYLTLANDGLSYDIQHVGTPALPQISCNPDAPDVFGIGSAGWTWGEVMTAIASQTGAVYYIDPDKVFRYVDDSDKQSHFGWAGVSDAPNGTTTLGYRDVEFTSDGARLTNDHLQWGAGQGSATLAFAREQDATSIATHGRWQTGELRYDMYCQDSVELRAETWVHGSPQNRRGGKDDRFFSRFTVHEPYFRVADVISVASTEFGFTQTLPIRHAEVSFPTPWDIKCVLTAAHELDAPWQTHEFWIPQFRFDPPVISGPVLPDIVWPEPWPPLDPCECAGLVGTCFEDTFDDRTTSLGTGWGNGWSKSGTGNGSDRVRAPGIASFGSAGTQSGTFSSAISFSRDLTACGLPIEMFVELYFNGSTSTHAWNANQDGSTEFVWAPAYRTDNAASSATLQAGVVRNYVQLGLGSGLGQYLRIYNADGRLYASMGAANGSLSSIYQYMPIDCGAAATTFVSVRLEFAGEEEMRAKVWRSQDSEPGFWQFTRNMSNGNAAWSGFPSLSHIFQSNTASFTGFELGVNSVSFNSGDCDTYMGELLGLPGFGGVETRTDHFNRGVASGFGVSELNGANWHGSGSVNTEVDGTRGKTKGTSTGNQTMYMSLHGSDIDTGLPLPEEIVLAFPLNLVFKSRFSVNTETLGLWLGAWTGTGYLDPFVQLELAVSGGNLSVTATVQDFDNVESDSASTLSSVVSNEFWVRIFCGSDGGMKVRTWFDGDPEPSTWDVETAGVVTMDDSVDDLTELQVWLHDTTNGGFIVFDELSVDVVGGDPCSGFGPGELTEQPSGGSQTGEEVGDTGEASEDGVIFHVEHQYQRGSSEVWVDGLRIRLGLDYLEYPRSKRIEILDHINVTDASIRVNYVIWTVEEPAPTLEPE